MKTNEQEKPTAPTTEGGKAASQKEGKTSPKGAPAPEHPQVKELTETLQRLQAEFENAEKRREKEKREFLGYANAAFVRELLPFVDSMEQAVKNAEKAGAGHEKERKGLELLHKQLMDILTRHGLQEIRAVGAKFDPTVHDVMMNGNDAAKEDGVVLEEFQKGYKLRELVLRPAKVKVNKLTDKE